MVCRLCSLLVLSIALTGLVSTMQPETAHAQAERLQLAPPNPLARPAEITSTPLAIGAEPAPDPFQSDLDLDLTFDPNAPTDLTAAPAIEEPRFEVVVPDLAADRVPVQFTAYLQDGGPVLQRDLSWTVYALGGDAMGDDDIVLAELGGPLITSLPPGSYVVHVSYGLASLTRPLTVDTNGLSEAFTLNAGGMTLRGAISPDEFLPDDAVSFLVFPETVEDFETATPLARDVAERTVLVVPAGRYTIVSRYGDLNAVVRAQIDVEPGQLTEAVMFHNAARIILKLVNEPNGEALPNTAWSVLTPGGDIVREFVGAFPSMVLSEGDYTIIARHDGQVFSREFSVVAGVDREEELVAQ